jgi:uncharacterized protein (DUF4213/DUF364 family)
MDFYQHARNSLIRLTEQKGITGNTVSIISARPLSSHDAIGSPERKDFPLLNGREFMMEAIFKQSKGQAYTDMPGDYEGTVKDVLSLDLNDNFDRAVFVATLNAVTRHFGLADGTIHCRDKEPGMCARQLPDYVRQFGKDPKIALVGLQPAMAEQLTSNFPVRIVDLDQGNIGTEKFGVSIEGPDQTKEILSWCDLVLATGSMAVNGTITGIGATKPVIFYGVTIAGAAQLLGYRRYCPFGH